MNNQDLTVIYDSQGRRGLADLSQTSTQQEDKPQVLVKFEGQLPILVERALLKQQADGSYLLPWAVTGLVAQEDRSLAQAPPTPPDPTLAETVVIPVIEETVHIAKRSVESDRLRIRKVVHEAQETVDVPLLTEEIDVQRIPVNQIVAAPERIRQEGDTFIIPIYEEVLVVQKQLLLKEEVHIRKRQTEQHQSETVVLRKEEVLVEPIDSPAISPEKK